MKTSNRLISLQDIDIGNSRFKISAGEGDLPSLARSVRETGLAVPPVVFPGASLKASSGTADYIPVSGFRRLLAVRNLGDIPSVMCQVLEDEADCAIRAVQDNAFQRDLTLLEMIRAVTLLARYFDGRRIADLSVSIFNKALNQRYIKELINIGSLPDPAMALIRENRLALKPAKMLTGYDMETASALLAVLKTVKASASKQLDIMTCFYEICARDRIAPDELVSAPELAALMAMETGDAGLRGDRIRQYLVSKRYPALEQTRARVRSHLAKLKLDRHVRFSLPENFESDVYGISIAFTNLDEFKRRTDFMRDLSGDPHLKAILNRE